MPGFVSQSDRRRAYILHKLSRRMSGASLTKQHSYAAQRPRSALSAQFITLVLFRRQRGRLVTYSLFRQSISTPGSNEISAPVVRDVTSAPSSR